MVFIAERYYNAHRIMLTILGLWPYQKLSILRIQTTLLLIIFFSSIFFQLTIFLTTKYDIEFIVQEITYICPFIVYILNYNCFYFNSKLIKQLMEHIKLDWKVIKDSNELKILEKYTYVGYVFGLVINVIITFVLLIFTTVESIPVILDTVVPLNKSRSYNFKVPFEFFIDEEQHYLLYLIFEIVITWIGIWSTVTTNMFLFTVGGHICATLKIASNLFQNTVTESILQIPAPHRIYFMYQNICRAVHLHRRTTQLVANILSSFNIWLAPLLVIGVLSCSCSIFRLLNAMIRFNDFTEIFVSLMIFIGHFVYMFMTNFCGQVFIDHCAEILKAVYNTLWYVAPLSIQKLLLILLKSVKNFKLVVGGIFIPSHEGFSTLITSTISYFTVIYSM